jgi:ABC-2 type transport system ATP-binding protein
VSVLSVEHLSVKYSGRPVLRDVSFSVAPGEIVAYLGANGSGKTTTVRVLTGLLTPGNGRVRVDGRAIEDDLVGYRRRLGYVPETADVYPFLSGREYLQLVGRLRALRDEVLDERVDELLETLGLGEHRYQALSSYSKGMRQKVLLCAALLHDPEILILDEPLTGLDVTAVMVTKALLRELAARGRTILYSTHLLEVAETLCRRVLILHDGRIVADDSVENLRRLSQQPSLEAVFSARVLDESPDAIARRVIEIVSSPVGG